MWKVLVRWERDGLSEETWEPEQFMREDYPELFVEFAEEENDLGLNLGTNFPEVGENCNIPAQSPCEFGAQSHNPTAPPLLRVYKRRGKTPSSSHTRFPAKLCQISDSSPPLQCPPSSEAPQLAGVVEVSFSRFGFSIVTSSYGLRF